MNLFENSLFVATSAHPLVHLNAALNTLATVLLIAGLVLIKQGRRQAHGRTMIAAFVVSCLFLISYLTYHYTVLHVKFTHEGTIRTIYYTILLSHIALAVVVPFLATATLVFAILGTGFRGAAELPEATRLRLLTRHRSLARWTLPIWLYVSVTGVVVYAMLYHLWPPTSE